jgi:hypothetical protein
MEPHLSWVADQLLAQIKPYAQPGNQRFDISILLRDYSSVVATMVIGMAYRLLGAVSVAHLPLSVGRSIGWSRAIIGMAQRPQGAASGRA